MSEYEDVQSSVDEYYMDYHGEPDDPGRLARFFNTAMASFDSFPQRWYRRFN